MGWRGIEWHGRGCVGWLWAAVWGVGCEAVGEARWGLARPMHKALAALVELNFNRRLESRVSVASQSAANIERTSSPRHDTEMRNVDEPPEA